MILDLGPGSIAVPDQQCHPSWARSFEPFIAAGLSDREAWESLFSDRQRLAWFRLRHGNDGQRLVQHPGPERVRVADGSGA